MGPSMVKRNFVMYTFLIRFFCVSVFFIRGYYSLRLTSEKFHCLGFYKQ